MIYFFFFAIDLFSLARKQLIFTKYLYFMSTKMIKFQIVMILLLFLCACSKEKDPVEVHNKREISARVDKETPK